jgi:hypothetical protein
MLMLYQRDHFIGIQKFLDKENAFEEVEKARKLLSSEGNFVNQM